MAQDKSNKEKKPFLVNFSFVAKMKTKSKLLLEEVNSPRLNSEQGVEASPKIDKRNDT